MIKAKDLIKWTVLSEYFTCNKTNIAHLHGELRCPKKYRKKIDNLLNSIQKILDKQLNENNINNKHSI